MSKCAKSRRLGFAWQRWDVLFLQRKQTAPERVLLVMQSDDAYIPGNQEENAFILTSNRVGVGAR